MRSQKSEVRSQKHPPYELITPSTPSYLSALRSDTRLATERIRRGEKRGCRRQGRYFKGKMGGFTLIELIITMLLIGIIAYIVATALSTGIKAYFTTDFRKEALDQSRIAMERMTREIRNLRDSSSVIASSPTQFNFTDIDGNAINFIWTSPNITRNADTLATNITSCTFGYIRADSTNVDAAFNPALPPDPARTRRIRITITATKNTESVTLQSEVWPRSL